MQKYHGELPAWLLQEVATAFAEPGVRKDRPINLPSKIATASFELNGDRLKWVIEENGLLKLGVPSYRLGPGSRLTGEKTLSQQQLAFWCLHSLFCD